MEMMQEVVENKDIKLLRNFGYKQRDDVRTLRKPKTTTENITEYVKEMFTFKRNFCEQKMNIQKINDIFLSANEDGLEIFSSQITKLMK